MKFNEPTPEQLSEWDAWLAGRPGSVIALAKRFNPWTMYRNVVTGQLCRVISFYEADDSRGIEASLGVIAEHPVLGEITRVKVMGMKPDDLVPWTEQDESARVLPKGQSGSVTVTAVDHVAGTITMSLSSRLRGRS